MVEVVISNHLLKEVEKRLSKKQADKCLLQMYELENNPHKGDVLTVVGGVVSKEIRYEGFRFYFIHSSKILKLISEEELKQEIIKFIAMSDKSKEQQNIIDRIKQDLKKFGFEWF